MCWAHSKSWNAAIARAQMAHPLCSPVTRHQAEAWMIEWVFYRPDPPEASARGSAFRVKSVFM